MTYKELYDAGRPGRTEFLSGLKTMIPVPLDAVQGPDGSPLVVVVTLDAASSRDAGPIDIQPMPVEGVMRMTLRQARSLADTLNEIADIGEKEAALGAEAPGVH